VTASNSVIATAAKTVTALSVATVITGTIRRVCDGGSTPVRRSRFLRCHYVRVGVVVGGQSSSEEIQNPIECLTEKIHEVAGSFFVYFTSRGHRTAYGTQACHDRPGAKYPDRVKVVDPRTEQ
jgi:hypothetical protein